MKLHTVTVKMLVVSSMLFSMMPGLSAAKGVSLDATRIIYPQNEKSVSVTVKNSDPQVTYLTRAFITDEQNKVNKLFDVTPPVFKVTPGAKQEIRIFGKNNQLPTDRETMFYFHATMISGQNGQVEGDALNIGYDHVLKLFYRPKNLPMTSEQAQEKLRFKVEGNTLTAYNDSPYYINLAQISVNNQLVNMSMEKKNTTISPFSSLNYPISQNMKKGNLTWRVITDLGGTNEFKTQLQ
ncbi:molecular chaperone [Providencia rettgeri]|uniref:fimbrial biogenesis chaperone n=1 Tax=Providencia rettgeri TaxID=587 RepID=UPI0034E07062